MTQQLEAQNTWAQADKSILMPRVMQYSADESSKLNLILSEINTYKSEMILKFIMGIEPISKFDEFVKRMKSMGIDDAVKINQVALDRFNARK